MKRNLAIFAEFKNKSEAYHFINALLIIIQLKLKRYLNCKLVLVAFSLLGF